MGNINESKKRSVSLNTNPNHKASCPVRMAIRKNIKSHAGKDGEERECKLVWSSWRTVRWFLPKLKIDPTCGWITEGIEVDERNTCISIFITAPFIMTKAGPSLDECIKEM